MNDLLSYNFDKIIVGINNVKHLNEIINFKKIKKKYKKFDTNLNNSKLYDPRKWKFDENEEWC